MEKDKIIKERILTTASQRMLKFGYRKVSMDEIANDLRMSKNTIYKYFPSKLDIAENIIASLKEKINNNQITLERNAKNPLEIISKNIIFLQKELAPWFDLFLRDIQVEIPQLWQKFIDYRREKIFEIKDLIEKGIKKGVFREVNALIAVRAYLGAIESIIDPEFLEHSNISFQEALEAVLDIWAKGILQD